MLEDGGPVPEGVWTQMQLYQQQIALYHEHTRLLKLKITDLEEELFKRDSPESVALLRDQMHHYRRQCDDIMTKLKEAEAHIVNQEDTITEKNQQITELLHRCQQLEAKDLKSSNR